MLSDYESQRISALWKKLKGYRPINAEKKLYYDAKNSVRDLGISVPPQLRNVQEAVGWPAVAVDTLNDRIMLDGFHDELDLGLNEIFDENSMITQGAMANLDALLYGIGFIMVSNGDTSIGEPAVLVTAESPNHVTTYYNQRKRRVEDAIHVTDGPEGTIFGTYLTEYDSIPFIIKSGSVFEDEEAERVDHGFGRVPIVQILNRPQTGSVKGRSVITEPIISTTNSMMRTLLSVEVSREFFAAPMRYILGAAPENFVDKDGNTRGAIDVLMDKVLVLNSEDGEAPPTVGQFSANSPAPYTDLMHFYANLFSSYTGLPMHYFGQSAANPSSEGAITAGETRLVKQAENFNDNAMRPYSELAALMILARDGELPEGFKASPVFRDPRTPTRAAAADEVLKLVSSGIIRPDSSIVYNRLGLSRAEVNTIKAENNMATTTDLVTRLRMQQEEKENTPSLVKTENDISPIE